MEFSSTGNLILSHLVSKREFLASWVIFPLLFSLLTTLRVPFYYFITISATKSAKAILLLQIGLSWKSSFKCSYVSDVLLGSVGGGGQLVLGNIQNNQDTVSCLIVFIWAFFYRGMAITVDQHFCLYGNRNNTRKKNDVLPGNPHCFCNQWHHIRCHQHVEGLTLCSGNTSAEVWDWFNLMH